MNKISLNESDLKIVIEDIVYKTLNEIKDFSMLKNKKSMINYLYNIINPYTRGLYRDDFWAGVSGVVKAIGEINGVSDIYYSAPDGGYRTSKDGLSKWKEYDLTIETENGIIIKGQLNAHAAGTVEDPFSAYDITITLW